MIVDIARSLTDLIGEPYIEAVCRAGSALTGEDAGVLRALADRKVAFYPEARTLRLEELFTRVGTLVGEPVALGREGAPMAAMRTANKGEAAPVNGFGCYRVGEDGRLYFTAKSEHYHIPLGHAFPGHELIDHARRLGIPNATHNTTRGFITRLLEEELIRTANGLAEGDSTGLATVLSKREPGILNRVINLETGSLAVEAALKMMLSRFYSVEGGDAPYLDRVPVFLTIGDNDGGLTANYHGTTLLEQTLRGQWPDYYDKAAGEGLYKVVPVAIGDVADFERKIRKYNEGVYKTAGFLHEIVLMNYAAIRLPEAYLREVYRLCRLHDTPVLCDEIQSCAWYPDVFLFRQYGLDPDFVSVGKGFPGGIYPASRIIANAQYDNLTLFGALVTNGQEELASLSYLITLEFLRANREHVRDIGAHYTKRLRGLTERYPALVEGVEGDAHMGALTFASAELAIAFNRLMAAQCIDTGMQTYKPNCPPVVLTKLPLVVTRRIVDAFVDRMDDALARVRKELD
jgi:acetylornithine/succinyldiaminopimelate/putrescine aminotransferase